MPSLRQAISQKTSSGVTGFLRQEAQVRKDCPQCFGKDYSDLYALLGDLAGIVYRFVWIRIKVSSWMD